VPPNRRRRVLADVGHPDAEALHGAGRRRGRGRDRLGSHARHRLAPSEARTTRRRGPVRPKVGGRAPGRGSRPRGRYRGPPVGDVIGGHVDAGQALDDLGHRHVAALLDLLCSDDRDDRGGVAAGARARGIAVGRDTLRTHCGDGRRPPRQDDQRAAEGKPHGSPRPHLERRGFLDAEGQRRGNGKSTLAADRRNAGVVMRASCVRVLEAGCLESIPRP
jgi:hypothetical protein